MNRENRRALKKKLRNKKLRTLAADVTSGIGDDTNNIIRDGDSVVLNVQQIMGRKDYPHMQDEYRKFVEENRNMVFVARPHHARSDGFSAIIELDGVEKWMFWYGDLLRVENLQAEEGE